MYPKLLIGLYTTIDKAFRDADILAGKSGRHMKFPYTMAAKIAQFPFRHYTCNNFIAMYYPVSIFFSSYFFLQCHRTANSESSKRSWAERQRKQAEMEHH